MFGSNMSRAAHEREVLVAIGLDKKIAHYFYGDGKQVQIFAIKRTIFIRAGDNVNSLIYDPIWKRPAPYPGSGDHLHPDRDGIDFSYETIGLYYGFKMPGTGWSGDC